MGGIRRAESGSEKTAICDILVQTHRSLLCGRSFCLERSKKIVYSASEGFEEMLNLDYGVYTKKRLGAFSFHQALGVGASSR